MPAIPSIQTIHDRHLGWDRSLEPAVTVASGETVVFDVIDASGGQLTEASTAGDVAAVDQDKVNPVTGPVYVEGAEPGDTLSVRIEAVDPGPWGWTALIPGFGLLSDDFPDPFLVHGEIGPAAIDWPGGLTLPNRPMIGTVGLAPAERGSHPVIPPRHVGGNLDWRDVRPGSTLHLPVEVEGALLSVGDTHACQGDGEVCGTAVEAPAIAIVRVEVDKQRTIRAPQLDLRAPARPEQGPVHATTGVGPDLLLATRDATRDMIDWLVGHHGLDAELAYCLCSVVGSLRISEVVNEPNWVVSLHLPLEVLA